MGKMGQTVIGALSAQPDIEILAGVDNSKGKTSRPDDSGEIELYDSIDYALSEHAANVVVDFSLAGAVLPLARNIIPKGVRLVSGTTGIDTQCLEEIRDLAARYTTGVIIAPNFAIGSVVMMHLASIASRYFEHAEIIELHHDKKADAPSGTALNTARNMLDNRGKPFISPDKAAGFASRGQCVDGINIHSIRLPGILARQQVILGTAGQTLSIAHAAISRDCYMPGVIMAVHRGVDLKEMVFGLDKLLGL
jgi:4-hydroxy-tetrahydrodipicolinate reductase